MDFTAMSSPPTALRLYLQFCKGRTDCRNGYAVRSFAKNWKIQLLKQRQTISERFARAVYHLGSNQTAVDDKGFPGSQHTDNAKFFVICFQRHIG